MIHRPESFHQKKQIKIKAFFKNWDNWFLNADVLNEYEWFTCQQQSNRLVHLVIQNDVIWLVNLESKWFYDLINVFQR